MDHIPFSDIKNFGIRNCLTILITITFLLTFFSNASWANHPDFYTSTSPQQFLSSQPNPKVSFIKNLDDRFFSEIRNKFSDHSNKYQFYGSREADFKHNKNKFNQERNATTQSALKDAFSKTINEIRWVLALKAHMKRLTTAQVRISKAFPLKGLPENQNSLKGGLEEDSYFIGKISLSGFPSLGIKLHASNPVFSTSLNYVPLNQFPFSLKMERNFIRNSKIGLNYSWSPQKNNLYTTLLFNF